MFVIVIVIYDEEDFTPVGGENPVEVGKGKVRIGGGGENRIAVVRGKNFSIGDDRIVISQVKRIANGGIIHYLPSYD